VMLRELDTVGTYDTAAEELGKTFVTTELGGGGTARAETVAIAKRGVRNLLIHAGVLGAELERASSMFLDMPDGDCYVASLSSGLVEFVLDLGKPVRRGDLVARVHDTERTGGAVADYRAARDGILAGRHFPGLVQTGDTLAVIGVPAAAP
jgi:N-alpha-acetyl-L-2,4-diaminobutyrate deacetylase